MSLNQGQMLAVLNALPDPVFVLTASGCYAGLFGHADPNYYHDGSDLMGSRLHDVLPAEVADWVLSHVQQSLQETNAEQAANLAERLRTQVTEDVVRELGEGKAFSLSLGVSELLTTDTDVQQVLHRVDQALYQAKANGRNCVLLYREDNSNTGS